jgi:hypothetical protein
MISQHVVFVQITDVIDRTGWIVIGGPNGDFAVRYASDAPEYLLGQRSMFSLVGIAHQGILEAVDRPLIDSGLHWYFSQRALANAWRGSQRGPQ